jgi:hypothetical protein
MILRRRFIATVLCAALLLPRLWARADGHTADDAVFTALAYLANQQTADGSFEPRGQKVAATGLGLLAFLSTGNTSDGGRYSANVRRATEFLLRQTPGDRYFGAVDGSEIRGHAIVTLALCGEYGVEPDEIMRAKIRATVKDAATILVAAQAMKKAPDDEGGWGEDRASTGSDPIISRWCLCALLAADKIGVTVPKENLNRAAAYLTRHPFADQDHPAKQPSHAPEDTTYFATRAAFERDASSWKPTARHLIDAQLSDGSWPDNAPDESPTRVRGASLAVLTLSLPMGLMSLSK